MFNPLPIEPSINQSDTYRYLQRVRNIFIYMCTCERSYVILVQTAPFDSGSGIDIINVRERYVYAIFSPVIESVVPDSYNNIIGIRTGSRERVGNFDGTRKKFEKKINYLYESEYHVVLARRVKMWAE